MSELFCKKTLNETVPSVRALLAVRLSKNGLTQKDIAKKLDITQPAVSHYINEMRGRLTERILANPTMAGYVDDLAKKLLNKDLDINTRICEMCKKSRASGVITKEEASPFLCLLEMSHGN